MVRGLTKGRVPKSIWVRRVRSCQRCPVYDHRFKRCGRRPARPMFRGCGCYIPFKATVKGAECWGKGKLFKDPPPGW